MFRGIVKAEKPARRKRPSCGTREAYRRHRRAREPVDELCEVFRPKPRRDPRTGLTERQTEVCAYLAQGLSNEQIAAKLFISEDTVKSHLRHIFKNLGFATRAELVAYAYRRGMLPVEAPEGMIAVPRDLYNLLVALARSVAEQRADAPELAGRASARLGLKTGRPTGRPKAQPAGEQPVSRPLPGRTSGTPRSRPQ